MTCPFNGLSGSGSLGDFTVRQWYSSAKFGQPAAAWAVNPAAPLTPAAAMQPPPQQIGASPAIAPPVVMSSPDSAGGAAGAVSSYSPSAQAAFSAPSSPADPSRLGDWRAAEYAAAQHAAAADAAVYSGVMPSRQAGLTLTDQPTMMRPSPGRPIAPVSATSSFPALHQPLQSTAALVFSADTVMQHPAADKDLDPFSGASGPASLAVVAAGQRRPAEQPAAPEMQAKRRQLPSAAWPSQADASAAAQSQQGDCSSSSSSDYEGGSSSDYEGGSSSNYEGGSSSDCEGGSSDAHEGGSSDDEVRLKVANIPHSRMQRAPLHPCARSPGLRRQLADVCDSARMPSTMALLLVCCAMCTSCCDLEQRASPCTETASLHHDAGRHGDERRDERQSDQQCISILDSGGDHARYNRYVRWAVEVARAPT